MAELIFRISVKISSYPYELCFMGFNYIIYFRSCGFTFHMWILCIDSVTTNVWSCPCLCNYRPLNVQFKHTVSREMFFFSDPLQYREFIIGY